MWPGGAPKGLAGWRMHIFQIKLNFSSFWLYVTGSIEGFWESRTGRSLCRAARLPLRSCSWAALTWRVAELQARKGQKEPGLLMSYLPGHPGGWGVGLHPAQGLSHRPGPWEKRGPSFHLLAPARHQGLQGTSKCPEDQIYQVLGLGVP